MTTITSILYQLDINNTDTWKVASDFLSEEGLYFVPIQLGTFRHSMLGLFSRLEEAIKRSIEAVCMEKDHYHSIEIVAMKMDEPIEFIKEKGRKLNTNEKVLVVITPDMVPKKLHMMALGRVTTTTKEWE